MPPRPRTDTIRFLTLDELGRLSAAARGSVRDRALVLLAYRHGPRASGVGLLRADDPDLRAPRLTVHRLKGSHSGTHPLQPDEAEAIRAWLRARPRPPSPVLFPSDRGDPIARRTLDWLMEEYGEAAGLPAPRRARSSSARRRSGRRGDGRGEPGRLRAPGAAPRIGPTDARGTAVPGGLRVHPRGPGFGLGRGRARARRCAGHGRGARPGRGGRGRRPPPTRGPAPGATPPRTRPRPAAARRPSPRSPRDSVRSNTLAASPGASEMAEAKPRRIVPTAIKLENRSVHIERKEFFQILDRIVSNKYHEERRVTGVSYIRLREQPATRAQIEAGAF